MDKIIIFVKIDKYVKKKLIKSAGDTSYSETLFRKFFLEKLYLQEMTHREPMGIKLLEFFPLSVHSTRQNE